MLPSFPSLRERNLLTLYGDTKVSSYTDVDKSPIGCVDRKVRPLVDLINSHPEYVTLSSCSGRVALFDPSGTAHSDDVEEEVKGTETSGKGRGKWIYVTHDIEPDLGHQIILALNKVGQERLDACNTSSTEKKNTADNNNEPPITFKHEPPLLHVGAASLEAGKKLLHIAKSICAMRESGLVVTDQRVTVELRTTGTLLCLPIMVQKSSNSKEELSNSVSLIPNEEYIKSLADIANERMVQNEVLLDKLYHTIQNELFENKSNLKVSTNNGSIGDDTNQQYNITLQSLPPLNLWKSAAVVIPRNDNTTNVDLIAFGGQGIGPEMTSNNETSKRWDAIFRLRRINGKWSECWDTLTTDPSYESEEIQLETSTGRFRIKQEASIGPREGHCACVMPSSNLQTNTNSAVLIFGGRTSGPLSPTNDLFLCTFTQSEENNQSICLGRPLDIVGEPPQPRFGHTMLVLNNRNHLAVIAGGTGVNTDGKSVSLSSVYTLSHMNLLNNESAGSHFIWDRISDMPNPRTYHTAFIEEKSNYMFVFGGLKEADDPFGSNDDDFSNMMMIQLPFSGKSTDVINIDEPLPSLIGSSSLKSDDLLLVVGGTKALTLSDAADEEDKSPINIFTKEQDENKLTRATISSVELLKQNEHSSGNIDLGSCVHHCLVALPKEKDDGSIASAVIVGGGVPSFSFGQSYAKSYVVNVSRGDTSNLKVTDLIPKLAKLSMKPTKTIVSSDNRQEKEITGKTLTKTDVVLVEARRAKEVKNELDRLGFLDKRYKMVKVEDSNLLAIPITEQYNVESSTSLKDMVVRVGKELLPFSSSYMSKIKQKR